MKDLKEFEKWYYGIAQDDEDEQMEFVWEDRRCKSQSGAVF